MFKRFNQFKLIPLLFGASLIAATQSSAHEYWIEPESYHFEDGNIIGYLRNGQKFKGGAFPFIERNFELFTLTNKEGTVKVTNRTGNSPALNMPVQTDGLHIAAYQNKFDTLKFSSFEKFTDYLDAQGLKGIAERHKERGLPLTGFTEQYARCAKALYRVGDVSGKDQLTDLKFEFVAQRDPYDLTVKDELTLVLYWEKKPLPNTQVEMFAFNGELKTTIHQTDENGSVTVPLDHGGKFLLNAVYMFEGDDDPQTPTAEWQSYWASIVFGIEGTDGVLFEAEQKAEKAKN